MRKEKNSTHPSTTGHRPALASCRHLWVVLFPLLCRAAGCWIQSPLCPVMLLQSWACPCLWGSAVPWEEQVAQAAVVSSSLSVSSSVCVLLAGPGQNRASLSPVPARRPGRRGTAMFFPNSSLSRRDTPLPIGCYAVAVKHRGKNFSQLPITCSHTQLHLGKCYWGLSPHLEDTWGTYVLFFLKLKALVHG